MMRPARLVFLLPAAACALYGAAPAQQGTSPLGKPLVSEKAPPPKWTAVERGAFFAKAGEHLGPEPTAEELAAPVIAGSESERPAPGGFAWSAIVPADVLETEVKALTAPLATAVKSPNDFKGGGFKTARRDFSTLAAVFGVAAGFDEDVRWKQQAGSLRDIFARAGKNCKVGTDGSYAEAKRRSDELEALIRGESVALDPAAGEVAWNEVADRPPLMERLEIARTERLKPWTGSKAEFTAHQDAILHEAALVAALAEIIADPSYDYAEDEGYGQYLKQLKQSAADAHDAAKKSDFERAQAAVGAMSQSCDSCHGDYR